MCADVLRRSFVAQDRAHDYLYDSDYVVSCGKDYARQAFKAAMASSQKIIYPVYKNMFSEVRNRINVIYYPNCRLPHHIDRSYAAYQRRDRPADVPAAELAGKQRFRFQHMPRLVLPLKTQTPDFQPGGRAGTPLGPTRPANKLCQTIYRESSAQTHPWQPDGRPAEGCEDMPEVMFLDTIKWGPGTPYRIGDLPADFHTTEIINKMRHARQWLTLVEQNKSEDWMKKRSGVIKDIETKDWIFREAEMDELQEIRLELLNREKAEKVRGQTTLTKKKLARIWEDNKLKMQKKICMIHRTRDRELRKLALRHESGGLEGRVAASRAARGFGSVTVRAHDVTSDMHAPRARHGLQAAYRHATITYDPTMLEHEDHELLAQPPPWLTSCAQHLERSCSGHHLPRDIMQLCERETKWSEQFLENLHNELKKARLGAAQMTVGPLKVLKPRKPAVEYRPATPVVEPVAQDEEACYQAALLLQKLVRGRAVHNLMYEGRTRAAELTEELKTTHGLQKEDRIRIAKEEAKATSFDIKRNIMEQKDNAIAALVDELCGGAVSAALDFLEKELRRLKEERRQHAFILIALREKTMREAAEAGRRQKEERRRREHDEMFKRVVGMTQETVDVYLQEIIREGVQIGAERDGEAHALAKSDRVEIHLRDTPVTSTAEENELVAELVQQFLLPEAHRIAARERISTAQENLLETARRSIFGLVDDAEIKTPTCVACGFELDDSCRCRNCNYDGREPVETPYRHDPRWKHTIARPKPPEKTWDERFTPYYDFRNMLNSLVDDAVSQSKKHDMEMKYITVNQKMEIYEKIEVELDAMGFVNESIGRAVGDIVVPVKKTDNYHIMRMVKEDALGRTEPPPKDPLKSGHILPSVIRQRADDAENIRKPWCKCPPHELRPDPLEQAKDMLPSQVRSLEELLRCKCDRDEATSPMHEPEPTPVSSNVSTQDADFDYYSETE